MRPTVGEQRHDVVGKAVTTHRIESMATLLALWWTLHVVVIIYFRSDNSYDALESTSNGSFLNQAQVVSYAALGLGFVLRTVVHLARRRAVWLYFLSGYMFWAALSITWSESPDLSLRRFVEFLLVCIGSIGVGGFYAEINGGEVRLARHLVIAGMIALMAMLPALVGELTLQNLLNPAWSPQIRRISAELPYSFAFGLLAAIVLLTASGPAVVQRRPLFQWLSGVFLLGGLLLFKARALIIFTIAIGVLLYFFSRRKGQGFVPAFLILLAIAIPLAFITGSTVSSTIGEFFARGEGAQTLGNLDGRLPLWDFVLADWQKYPWTGAGFGAYWTPSKLVQVWSHIHWNAPLAHNGFLDELVATGVVGLALILLFLLFGVFAMSVGLRSRLGHYRSVVLAFLLLLLVSNFTDSLFQFYFRCPFFFTLMFLTCCCCAASHRVEVLRVGFPPDRIR